MYLHLQALLLRSPIKCLFKKLKKNNLKEKKHFISEEYSQVIPELDKSDYLKALLIMLGAIANTFEIDDLNKKEEEEDGIDILWFIYFSNCLI